MSVEQTQNEWKYDAFISYRHLEPDAFVAGSIHKLLENYKVPSKLAKDSDKKLKRTRINKVFRDAEELPLTSNLNDSIMEALSNSEYLIVICSPRLNESLWCRKEIETFIEMRGIDHVLTVLAEGEPSVSFPEALLYKEVEVTEADGSVKKVKEPLEPLAADARGDSNKARLKKLKVESLRLMAPMFGCSFDDLRQRQRERKLKRAIGLASIVAAVGIAFGLVSTSMALKISSQNSQIIEQNAQITEQNDQIKAQAEEIERQYQEVLVSNANVVADYSETILEKGDRIEAIRRAYEVYPHQGVDVPVINKVEYVLSDALKLYDNGYYMRADRTLKCNSAIKSMFFSPGGTRVATLDADSLVSVWDTTNGKILLTYQCEYINNPETFIVFKNEQELWIADDEKLMFANCDMNKIENYGDIYATSNISYSEDENRLLAIGNDGLKLWDLETNKVIKSIEYKDYFDVNFAFSYGGSRLGKYKDKYYAVVLSGPAVENYYIYVYDSKTGDLIDNIEIGPYYPSAVKVVGEEVLLVTNHLLDGAGYLDTDAYRTDIYDIKVTDSGCDVIWHNELKGHHCSDIAVSDAGAGKYVACQLYDSVIVYDHSTGNVSSEETVGSNILKMFSYLDSDQFALVTKDGKLYVIADEVEGPLQMTFFESSSNFMSTFDLNSECAAGVDINSDIVIIYRYALSPKAESVDEYVSKEAERLDYNEILDGFEDLDISRSFVSNVFYSSDKSVFAIQYQNRKVELYNIDSKGKLDVSSCSTIDNMESGLEGIEVNADRSLIILYGYEYGYMYRTDGKTLPDNDDQIAFIKGYDGVDFDANAIYVSAYNEFYKLPIYSQEEIALLAEEELEKSYNE